MITIVRKNRIIDDRTGEILPAGEVLYFSDGEEIENACNFMWGRDINDYIMFRNGFRIEMDSDLYNLASNLGAY